MSGIGKKRAIFCERASPVRLLLVAFVLLAFSVQSFLTQSHVHPIIHDRAAVALHLNIGPAKPGNLPLGDDSMNCSLCKEILQSGHFLGSALLVFALPAQVVSAFETAKIPEPPTTHTSFRWNSRAPPRR
jgi:hypothetical protein